MSQNKVSKDLYQPLWEMKWYVKANKKQENGKLSCQIECAYILCISGKIENAS